jgi:hypothetical protein
MDTSPLDLAKTEPSTNLELEGEFKSLLAELVSKLGRAGFRKQATRSDGTSAFQNLRLDHQIKVLSDLRTYLNILNLAQVQNSADSFEQQDRHFIWSAFSHFGLVPSDDLFSIYKSGDVFEIYDVTGNQWFRNFEFFRICSYPLEDILCRSWLELYERDNAITQNIVAASLPLFHQEEKESVLNPVPHHYVKEISSQFRHSISISIKAFSPLKHKATGEILVGVIEKCHIEGVALKGPYEERQNQENTTQEIHSELI